MITILLSLYYFVIIIQGNDDDTKLNKDECDPGVSSHYAVGCVHL